LHAKLFVIDDGWNASVLTGSANASRAALHENVEFLVELRGSKKVLGIEALLEPASDKRSPIGFRELLVEWRPDTLAERREALIEEREAELRIERLQRALAAVELVVRARPAEGSTEREPLWDVTLEAPSGWSLPEGGFEVLGWPSRLPSERAGALGNDGPELARFARLSTDALTPFFAFELRPPGGERDRWKRFAMNLPTEGFPGDRESRVLRHLLSDRSQVLRLLWMLLKREKLDVAALLCTGEGDGRSQAPQLFPLLEALLESFARDRTHLAEVARLVDDLTRTPEGRELLPEGFLEVWEPVRAARGSA
jgi:hypothetical protein